MRNFGTWMMTMLASVLPALANAMSQHLISATRVNTVPSLQFAMQLPRTTLPLPVWNTLAPHPSPFRILGETVANPGVASTVLRAFNDSRDQHQPVAPEERKQLAAKPAAVTSDPQVRPRGAARIEYRGTTRQTPRSKRRGHWRPLATPQAWTNP